MKLSEWKLKMTDGVTSVLSRISGMGDKVSARFGGLQDKIIGAGDGMKKTGFQIPFLSNSFSKLSSMAGQTSGALGGVIQSLMSMKHPVALIAAAVIAFAAAMIIPIQKAGEFQQAMAEVSAITGIAGKDLDHLSDKSLDVGAKTGMGAMKAAEAYKLLASNIDIATIGGIKGLDELQEKTITLAQASGVDLPTAANTMAATINQFSLKATEAGRVINTLAAGAKFGAAEIPDLAESLKITGSTAAIAKVSLEDTVGALEVLSQNAIKGSEAGTGLRNVLLALQTKTKFMPGINLQADGLMKSLEKLKPHLKNTTLLAHMFGRENINAAQLLIKNASAVEAMGKKVAGTNTAYEQAAIQTNTYKGAMDRFRGTIESVSIKLGNIFLPGVTRAINAITNGISRMVDGITEAWRRSQFLHDVVGLMSWNFKIIGGVIKWTVVEPLRMAWHFVKRMLDAVNAVYERTRVLVGLNSKTEGKGAMKAAGAGGNSTNDLFDKPGEGGLDHALSEGTKNVSESGRSVKNINVNFKNLIENMNISAASLKESTADIQRIVEEALLRAVRGGEIAMEGE